MKLSKSDALFLYTVMWHYKSTTSSGTEVEERLSELLGTFSNFIMGDNEDEDEDESEDDEEESYDEDEDEEVESSADKPEVPEVANWLADTEVDKLQPVNVSYSDGAVTSLEFECCDTPDTVDVILDSEIIPDVHAIKLSNESISIWEPEYGWHAFKFVKKSPKSWSRLLKTDLVYGISTQVPAEDEQSDEDE